MSTSTSTEPVVRYVPFQSSAEPSFWMKLGEYKLNTVQLSEKPVSVRATYTVQSSVNHRLEHSPQTISHHGLSVSGRMRLDQDSIVEERTYKDNDDDEYEYDDDKNDSLNRNDLVHVRGTVKILNTLESFKSINKNDLLNDYFLSDLSQVYGISSSSVDTPDAENVEHDNSATKNNHGESNVSDALTRFFCLCHLDLKNHKVLYWFAFPVLVPVTGKSPRFVERHADSMSWQRTLGDAIGTEGVVSFHKAVFDLRVRLLSQSNNSSGYPPFFMAYWNRQGEYQCVELCQENYKDYLQQQSQMLQSSETGEGTVVNSKCQFVFLDPTGSSTPTSGSGIEDQQDPVPVGWPLRNLIAYVTLKLGIVGSIEVVSFRPGVIRRIDAASTFDVKDVVQDSSLWMEIELPKKEDYLWPSRSSPHNIMKYTCMGWELNARSKAGPRSVDLAPLLSTAHLAQQAADLNLKLMKWRMIPDLDLEYLSRMRVLLLGAGTLGCSVARTLLGWGVRYIQLVDNGKVSYSNPVRQNLFEVTDCENGGRDKAIAAADALKRIAGSAVQSEGYVATIPMPGHPFHDAEEELVRKDTEKLQALVDQADVIFLLTDTRESRWLPTVMAKASNKLLINAALGLDSWLVMRHGGNKQNSLGCYFCNDVVAPENSTNNRTLDQQCTVTRPGLAPLASSMAVELCIALVHHKEKQDAPAPCIKRGSSTFSPTVDESDDTVSPLGIMPHQIRGSIVSYTMMTPTVPAFTYCTGCCNNVIDAYRKDGFDFVKRVCCNTDGSYLDQVSGLSTFRAKSDAMMEDALDWEEEEEDGNNGQ